MGKKIFLAFLILLLIPACAEHTKESAPEPETVQVIEVDETQLKAEILDLAGEIRDSFGFQTSIDFNARLTDGETEELIFEYLDNPDKFPVFVDTLLETEDLVHTGLTGMLRRIGYHKGLVDAFIGELSNPDHKRSFAAMNCLSWMNANEKISVDLVWAMEDVDELMEINLCGSLVQLNRCVSVAQLGRFSDMPGPVICAGLTSDNYEIKIAAVHAAGYLNEWPEDWSVSELISDEDPELSRVTCTTLNLHRNDAPLEEIGIILLAKLNEIENPEIRRSIVWTLAWYEQGADVILPMLIEDLTSDDLEIIQNAIYSIGNLGPLGIDAAPELLVLCRDEDEIIKATAIKNFGYFGPGANEYSDELIAIAESSDHETGSVVAHTLIRMNTELDTAWDLLIAYLEDENSWDFFPTNGSTVLSALADVEPEYIDDIIGLLDHESVVVVSVACMAIGQIGPNASASESRLTEIIRDPDMREAMPYALTAQRNIQ